MFDPGALMARHFLLPDGLRVRLRVVRVRDRDGIRRLADATRAGGGAADELELVRLAHADPRQRLVLCATALLDSVETIVGVGAIELHDAAGGPSPLLADPRAEGVAELLRGALVGHARALADAA